VVQMPTANIDTVRELHSHFRNWGRWGPDDQLGTLNFVTSAMVKDAAKLIQRGKVVSLQIPLDEHGPQTGRTGRFNPIHLMRADGNDAGSEILRGLRGGRDTYFQGADDIIIMPLQCSTQWDSLSHVFFERQMYNGFSAEWVNSAGAYRNGVEVAAQRMVGRGVLLDMPRVLGVPYLQGGHAIGGNDLDQACRVQGVAVQTGDFLLVRTGAITEVRRRGDWGTYAGGDAPGLGLDSVGWLHEHQVAAVATDTWGMEVRPNETPDVFQPLHIVLIAGMGLWVGEIWDLDPLAEACAAEGRYEFFLSANPLVVSRAVGAPLNPTAIL
jgi:kynurenine formamidase